MILGKWAGWENMHKAIQIPTIISMRKEETLVEKL